MSIGLILPLFAQDCNPYQSKHLPNRTGESGLLFSPIVRTWRPNRRSGPYLPPRCCLCILYFMEKKCEVSWCLGFTAGACRRYDCLTTLAAFLWRCPFILPALVPVFWGFLYLSGSCFLGPWGLLPGLSERKMPKKISCGVQTVAPSLFSPLKKGKTFK